MQHSALQREGWCVVGNEHGELIGVGLENKEVEMKIARSKEQNATRIEKMKVVNELTESLKGEMKKKEVDEKDPKSATKKKRVSKKKDWVQRFNLSRI